MSRRPRLRAVPADRGQSLVEFALVVPLFLLLVLATIEFGRAAIIATSLENAAREGARRAAMAPTDTAAIVAAARRTATIADPVGVVVAFPDGSTRSGSPVRVTVDHRFTFVTPLVAAVARTDGFPLVKTSEMLVE